MSRGRLPAGRALVVGGSGGIGAAICRALVEAGSGVAFTYRSNAERAAELVAELDGKATPVDSRAMDIGDEAGVRTTVDAIAARERIHTVVFAAGSDIKQPMIRDLSPADWRAVIEADVHGFFNVVSATLPHLKAGGGGSYVHISSAGLHRWPDGDVLSVAPKACIESLIQGIAKEEGRFGVRANSVAIGVIESGIFLRLWREGVFDQAWKDAVLNNLCLKRFGQPEEVADAVLYLARSEYVTGQVLSVDGGYGV